MEKWKVRSMSIPKLGKIVRVEDLRSIWKNEATDFTPWVAENLDLLGESLDMNLSFVERESSVGGYSLDILAEDEDTGEKVVIENQLEQTNHEHLGKILTYAAGKKAKKIIWIVKNARDEHRAAIEWLNNMTLDDVQFFLVEIQLWSIDASISAPKFEIIERPNNWSKAVKNFHGSDGGEAVQFKYSYWSKFNDYMYAQKNEFTQLFAQKKASSDHWYTLSIGSKKYMQLLVNTRTDVVTVEFTVPSGDNKDKTEYNNILGHKEEIEQAVGESLDWRRLDDKKVSRILLEHQCNLKDENSWISIFDWYREYAVKVYKAFKPYI